MLCNKRRPSTYKFSHDTGANWFRMMLALAHNEGIRRIDCEDINPSISNFSNNLIAAINHKPLTKFFKPKPCEALDYSLRFARHHIEARHHRAATSVDFFASFARRAVVFDPGFSWRNFHAVDRSDGALPC